MTFLPVVARELRVAARRRSTYWVRTGAALLVMGMGTWVYLMFESENSKDLPLLLFGVLGFAAVLHCWLSGVRSTADCLSQEKREGTFGLLFLTDLKGYDVVLGKLVASSINSIYGVLAVVPMLAVPMIMGGVAPAEVGRMALVALNTLFFSLAVGLCVSAMSRSARKAMGLTFLLLLFFTAVLPIVSEVLTELKRLPQARCLLLSSVGLSYAAAFDLSYKTMRSEFWGSLAVVHGMAWLCLLLAAFIAPRSWQDRPAGLRALRWRERLRLWSFGNLAARYAFRRRLLDTNAFYWLAARERLKPALVWATLGVLSCGWLWGLAKFRRDWLNGGIYAMSGLVLNALLKFWCASETGRQLAAERQQGALELLLSTPLTVRDILRGQRLALNRQFLGPACTVLVVFLLLMLASLSETADAEQRLACVCFYSAGMLMLVVDLAALYWVGMWQGLSSKNPNRATNGSVGRILVMPWVGIAVALAVMALMWANRGEGPSWKFFIGLWVSLGLAVDIAYGVWARHKLLTTFRLAAEQRYAPRRGFWKRLFAGSDVTAGGAPPVIGTGE